MQLPVDLKNVFHKHGGRIVRITKFTHETAKPKEGRSRDIWFFIGDVEWFSRGEQKGGKSTDLEIMPYSLCYENEKDRAEVDQLINHMNEYLREHGEWCGPESKHEGWYANDRKGASRGN